MAEHTPGPWIKQTMEVSNSQGQWIANFFNILAFDDETMQANARLIAAAPDMRNALEITNSAIGLTGSMESWQLDIVRAALAKARGEA